MLSPISTTWYTYTGAGNVERIITEQVAEAGRAGSVVKRGLRGGDRPTSKVRDAHDERAGDSSAGSTAAACGAGETLYTATRFGYAKNAQTVTHVLGEEWCWNSDQPETCPTNYTVTWAREFRYDGARARYMNRALDANLFTVPGGTVWSDYE